MKIKLATITITTRELEVPLNCPDCGEFLHMHPNTGPTLRVSVLRDVERCAGEDDGKMIYADSFDPDTLGGLEDAPYMVQCAHCGHILAGDTPNEGGLLT
jgi:hypothetical protein